MLNTCLENTGLEVKSSQSLQSTWLKRVKKKKTKWFESKHSHMSFSLMMPQKYCGFSTKLDKPESSSEEGGLVPKFKKRRDTARSSSALKTDDPDERGRDTKEPP